MAKGYKFFIVCVASIFIGAMVWIWVHIWASVHSTPKDELKPLPTAAVQAPAEPVVHVQEVTLEHLFANQDKYLGGGQVVSIHGYLEFGGEANVVYLRSSKYNHGTEIRVYITAHDRYPPNEYVRVVGALHEGSQYEDISLHNVRIERVAEPTPKAQAR